MSVNVEYNSSYTLTVCYGAIGGLAHLVLISEVMYEAVRVVVLGLVEGNKLGEVVPVT